MLQIFTKKIRFTKSLCCIVFNKNFSTSKQHLPKLPVPELQDTLQKYLKSVMPILTDVQLQDTVEAVKEFGKKDGIGEHLQKLLVNRAKTRDNWLEEWWLNIAYLGSREPVVVHSSPGVVMPIQKFIGMRDQLAFASKLIVAALKFKEMIDKDKIPQEKIGNDLLDMTQYKILFGTCRIPKSKLDKLQHNPRSDFIIVVFNNHFFKMYPYNKKNILLNDKQIDHLLNEIVAQAKIRILPVGILSSDHRDKWATNYQLLLEDPQNAKCVEAIQKSLFLVCLDGGLGARAKINLTVAGQKCIHGGGRKLYSGNRWFDKTIQFIIDTNGIVGLTFEHSPIEGQPIAAMTDFIIDHINDPSVPEVEDVRETELLKFKLNKELSKAIQESSDALNKLVDNVHLKCKAFTKFGTKFIKTQKLSPDSFIQMAMQLGYYRLHNQPATHYESVSTRKYNGGRTEAIRSCSVESIQFVKAMLNKKLSPMEKKNYMIAAINAHKHSVTNALNGHGIDRHLLGLQLIALENGIELPKIFTDQGFVRSKHFLITSSQVAMRCSGFMCYGPVVLDGYGICYNPRDNDIYFGFSCFKTTRTTNAFQLKYAFEISLKDMKRVLVTSETKK